MSTASDIALKVIQRYSRSAKPGGKAHREVTAMIAEAYAPLFRKILMGTNYPANFTGWDSVAARLRAEPGVIND